MALARPVVGPFLLKRIGKRLGETFDIRAVTSDSFLPHAYHVGRIRRTGSEAETAVYSVIVNVMVPMALGS